VRNLPRRATGARHGFARSADPWLTSYAPNLQEARWVERVAMSPLGEVSKECDGQTEKQLRSLQ
jgi:hypothetical protein